MGSVACGSATMPTGPADAELSSAPVGAENVSVHAASTAPSAFVGEWTLVSIDGARLPAIASGHGDVKVEVLSDTLTLRADGTSTERAESRFTAGPRVQTSTTVEDGSFRSADGSTLQLVGRSGRVRTATLNRGLLFASVDGKTWVFFRN
jgi:hypothetical protein